MVAGQYFSSYKPKKMNHFDKEPWHKNHESPMAKWLHNFAMIGGYLPNWLQIIWLIVFNPALVILYITIGCIVALFHFG